MAHFSFLIASDRANESSIMNATKLPTGIEDKEKDLMRCFSCNCFFEHVVHLALANTL